MSYYHPIPDKNKLIDQILKTIVDLVAVGMFVYFILLQTCIPFRIDGISMEPVLKESQWVLTNQMAYRFSEPKRLDVIAFEKDGQTYIKRIVGVPGDTLSVEDGHLYVNGTHTVLSGDDEAMIYEGVLEETSLTLREGEFFVVGDNWNASEDSRNKTVGLVWKDEMRGKVWARIYPFQEISLLKMEKTAAD